MMNFLLKKVEIKQKKDKRQLLKKLKKENVCWKLKVFKILARRIKKDEYQKSYDGMKIV